MSFFFPLQGGINAQLRGMLSGAMEMVSTELATIVRPDTCYRPTVLETMLQFTTVKEKMKYVIRDNDMGRYRPCKHPKSLVTSTYKDSVVHYSRNILEQNLPEMSQF